MATKKLTRKEIREDRIRSILVAVYDWLVGNRTYLLGAAGAVILLFAATYAWESFQRGRQHDVQERYADALEMVRAQVGAATDDQDQQTPPPKYRYSTEAERDAAALEAFSALAGDYSGTSIGRFALYYEAIFEHKSGQSEKAESTLRSLLDSSPELELRNLARNYLAFVLQVQGKGREAVEVLQSILEEPSVDFPRSTVLLNLAHSYDSLGDREAALENYKKLRAEYPSSADSRAVQARIDLLEGQLGEEAEAPEKTDDESGE